MDSVPSWSRSRIFRYVLRHVKVGEPGTLNDRLAAIGLRRPRGTPAVRKLVERSEASREILTMTVCRVMRLREALGVPGQVIAYDFVSGFQG